MGELQWNLLNTNAPAQVAASFNPLGAFNEGQKTAMELQGGRQKLQMNDLAMEKTRQDMEYAPMKIYAGMMGKQATADKNIASTEKIKLQTAKEEKELSMIFSLESSNAAPGQVLPMVFKNIDKMASLTGKSAEEATAQKAQYQALHDQLGEDWLRANLYTGAMKVKDQIALQQGDRRLDIQETQGNTRNQIAATNAQTGQGNLAVNQQRLSQPNVQFINTGEAFVPVDKKQPLVAQPTLETTMKPGQQEALDLRAQGLNVKEIGANRPHVANLMANGWMPTGRITKPMLDSIEAAATEAEKQGLPFNPNDLRAYEFQGQKNTSLGRTAGSRLVQGREQNIETAEKLLIRMRGTAQELDFSEIKIAAIADKWIKGQLQDPVLTRYMTQRADALFALGNALKQNGITDKAIQVEEEAANPTVSPKAFDAWYTVQMQALSDAKGEMKKAYSPQMPNTDPAITPKASGRFTIIKVE